MSVITIRLHVDVKRELKKMAPIPLKRELIFGFTLTIFDRSPSSPSGFRGMTPCREPPSVVRVLYRVEHVVFCMRGLENEGQNIEDTLPNLVNVNHIRRS